MDYLFKSSICMTVFYGLYFLSFRRLSFHALNRFYLLASLALCLTIPILSYEREEVVIIEPNPVSEITYSEEIPKQSTGNQAINIASKVIHPQSLEIDWMQVLTIIYLSGMSIMLLFFLRNILIILKSLTSASLSDRYEQNGNIIISITGRSPKPQSNASFFNYIFLNPDNLNPHEQALIIAHESFHAKQLHTLDLLLISFLKAIFWFNPIIYFYQKSLKQIHEYEVDSLMSATHDSHDYAHLLLKLGVGTNSLIINQFSTKPLSDRIQFLFTKPTKNMKKLLYFLSIPIIGFGVMAFAQEKVRRVYQEKKSQKVILKKEQKTNIQSTIPIDTTTKKNIQIASFTHKIDFTLNLENIDSLKVSVDNQFLIEGKGYILKGNSVFLDQKYTNAKAKIHLYAHGNGNYGIYKGSNIFTPFTKLDELSYTKVNKVTNQPIFEVNNSIVTSHKLPLIFYKITRSEDTLRTILETNKLGKNPLVIINGEEYPSSILYRINPDEVANTSIYPPNNQSGLDKFGEMARDGIIQMVTKGDDGFLLRNEKEYKITIEKVKKSVQDSKKRVRRYNFQTSDGKKYEGIDIISINTGSPQISIKLPLKDNKVIYFLDGELVSEEEISNSNKTFVSVSSSTDKELETKYHEEVKQGDVIFNLKTKRD